MITKHYSKMVRLQGKDNQKNQFLRGWLISCLAKDKCFLFQIF